MAFRLQLSHKLQQKLMADDPMTESVFIVSECYLTKCEGASKNQKLLSLFASLDQMEKYRSILDMLLCQVFPEYKRACFNYYWHGGKQLKEVASEKEIELLDKALFLSLVIANEVVKREIKYPGKKIFIMNCREIISRSIPYSREIAERHASCTLFLNDEQRQELT